MNQAKHGRRELLTALAGGALLLADGPAVARRALAGKAGVAPDALAKDEAFWFDVRQAFSLDGRYAILNAGGSNPPPRAVVEAHLRNVAFISPSPLVNTLRVGQFPAQAAVVRKRLAGLIGARHDEVALTRNTTEGMNIAIGGLQLAPGDEILTDPYCYYSTRWALDQRARRDNIVVRNAPVRLPRRAGDDLAAAYIAAIGPKTKAIVLTHVVDGIGQIMPVAAIATAASARGIVTIVDGALSFGCLRCDMAALGCDVFATSLHKFLLAPQGTGMLFVRRETIERIWPMYGVEHPAAADIEKYETIGTRPYAEIGAIQPAIDFHEAIGAARKEARLQYLKRYWHDQLSREPRVRFGASAEPDQSCATLQVGIDGVPGRALSRHIVGRHDVLVYGPIASEGIDGIYAAPNVFTTLGELDRLVAALRDVLANGVAAEYLAKS